MPDSNTKLLLHMNSDCSDSSASGHTPTVSGATIDTGIKKFGAGSGKFVYASSQYVSYPGSSDWHFNTDNFSLDFQLRLTTATTADPGSVIALANSFDSSSNYWYAAYDFLNNRLLFFNYLSSSFTVYWYVDWLPSIETWYHVALERKGLTAADWTYYVNGIALTAGKTLGGGSWNGVVSDFTGNFFIGKHGENKQYLNGHLDEFRISKGIARWGSDFTPPSSEYNGAPPSGVQIFRRRIEGE
jgi:hypothetical protein